MKLAPAAALVLRETCVVAEAPVTGTEAGLKLTVRPATGTEEKATVPAKPFTLVTVPVESTVEAAPVTTLTVVGERLQVKSVTLTETVIGAASVLFCPVVKLLAT
jgi:hypothetical protein